MQAGSLIDLYRALIFITELLVVYLKFLWGGLEEMVNFIYPKRQNMIFFKENDSRFIIG